MSGWVIGWVGFSLAGFPILHSLVHNNGLLSSALRCERKEQKQLHEQGHPTASQDDDITVSSGPAKTQSSNNQGKGQVILPAERQSWCQASANYQGLGVLLKVTQELLIPASAQPHTLRTVESHQQESPPLPFPRRKVSNCQNQNRYE